MRGRDRADAERHVPDESVRDMQLLRRVVVGDTVAYRCEVGLAGDEPELQASSPTSIIIVCTVSGLMEFVKLSSIESSNIAIVSLTSRNRRLV